MGRSTVHYADSETNNILKRLHNKLRPAGTPVQRVEYIIELLLLRIFEVKIQQDPEFAQLRAAFKGGNDKLLFSELATLANEQILPALNQKLFPFYARILSEARKVWKGNLSTKVQDQLVLIEEVFSNSNFSNNVTSGNMAEIIGLVTELDKDRLLKTDLLGDAIESALSETGGTNDIGLHRTPDHIRQFMVGLAAPTFDDQIFDPTVGTGGFMFDSFEYVMQGVSQDGHWPGPKSHPELAAWFKDWFDKHRVPMPSIETTTDFYRTGVGGIEYLGMIRKMAAINFYVRGLNPGNIQQGDSLEKFGTDILPKSKTVILANPPFGAERDKESYPNVWSEYPTESETTILFVKLMLESLKPGGRCGVIVSEGFLTWDQNSARALRRALLDECGLQAVISLPQGVFVSKGGQGPKTSILFFVKGGITRNVWFYKVTNDGFTAGTNRRPVPGCQFVAALDLFHRYVCEGKQPPETRHSFCVPAEWIKVLDPRVKDKIRDETRAEIIARAVEDKAKLTEKLDAQVAAKKLTATERKNRLSQHNELWLSKTENAVAQKIERAHLYSFNLPNYRSSLTPTQLEAWKDFASSYVREDDPSKTLEKRCRTIAAAKPEELDELISGLDPRHTLELDIARQFLTGISPEVFTKHPHLRTLQEIIASQQKTPRVRLKDVCDYEKGKFPTQATPEGPYPFVVTAAERKTADNFQIDGEAVCVPLISSTGHGKASMHRIHYEKGKFAVANLLFTLRPRSLRDLNTKFLYWVLSARLDELFVPLMKGTANVALKLEDAIEAEFPLPPIDEQEALARDADQLAAIAMGCDAIEKNWAFSEEGLNWDQQAPLGELLEFVSSGSTPLGGDANYVEEGVLFIRSQNVLRGECDFSDAVFITKETHRSMGRTSVLMLDVFLNITGASIGRSAVMESEREANVNQHVAILRPRRDALDPHYLCLVLNTNQLQRAINKAQIGASRQGLNFAQIKSLQIPICQIERQRALAQRFRDLNATRTRIRDLAKDARSKLKERITHIWET
jgi:type I restriction-modification system DNA methylase subunit